MTDTDLPELRRRAEQGDRDALDGLVQLADAGNAAAADQLLELRSE
jgi:hypothetical protein